MSSPDFPILVRWCGVPIYHDAKRHGRGTLCSRCERVKQKPWVHPLLKYMKDRGLWKGTIYGGILLCDPCAAKLETEEAVKRVEEADQQAFTESGIPNEFRGATWRGFESRGGKLTRQIESFSKWVKQDDPPWLYIFGRVGTGKTRAASTLVLDWMRERSTSVKFMTLLTMTADFRRDEFERDLRYTFRSHTVARKELFVIDDLGAAKVSDYGSSTLLEALEARHELGRVTIVTSNLNLDQLSTHLDNDRISSRLLQWCELVKLDGVSDYRHEDAKRKKAKR